jgi:hypothetical protein
LAIGLPVTSARQAAAFSTTLAIVASGRPRSQMLHCSTVPIAFMAVQDCANTMNSTAPAPTKIQSMNGASQLQMRSPSIPSIHLMILMRLYL